MLNIRGAKTSCFSGKQSFEERKRIFKGEETRHVKTQGIIYLLKTSATVIDIIEMWGAWLVSGEGVLDGRFEIDGQEQGMPCCWVSMSLLRQEGVMEGF